MNYFLKTKLHLNKRNVQNGWFLMIKSGVVAKRNYFSQYYNEKFSLVIHRSISNLLFINATEYGLKIDVNRPENFVVKSIEDKIIQ